MMKTKTAIYVVYFFLLLFYSTSASAIPVISYGPHNINATDNGTQILRGSYEYGFEVNGGYLIGNEGFTISQNNFLGVATAYDNSSSILTSVFTITNTLNVAQNFAMSIFFDLDIGSPTAQAACIDYIGGGTLCDTGIFEPSANALIASNLFDPTKVAVSMATSAYDAVLKYQVGHYDDTSLAEYSHLSNSDSGGIIGDIALGIGYEALVAPSETITMTYKYLICTDQGESVCGLVPVPDSATLHLMLIGLLLLFVVVYTEKNRVSNS